MATKITTTIQKTGPFFAKDPGKTFRQNARILMAAVAFEGERDVRAQMQAGNARRRPISRLGGHASDHVLGRTAGISGRPWAVSAVVSVRNTGFSPIQGVSLMAAASRVEQETHAFRRTTSRIRRSRAANLEELLKGIE
jgi:hypothetical protein